MGQAVYSGLATFSLLILIALIVGLFKPGLVLPSAFGKPSIAKVAGTYFGILVLLALAMSAVEPAEVTQRRIAEQKRRAADDAQSAAYSKEVAAKLESDKAEKVRLGDASSATVMARQFVEKRLKSPATAKFSEESAVLHESVWFVKGAVDSQNSFGAMLRLIYLCRVRHAEGDTWILVVPCEIASQ
ncbi:MAG: hypothetical protein ABI811_01705 [Acidobacteriota bacterium]